MKIKDYSLLLYSILYYPILSGGEDEHMSPQPAPN